MAFDVIRFLDDHGIQWWPPGSTNVSRGHVGIQCPFCDDSLNHMGLEITGKKRPYCWKCGGHSWPKLIRALTGSSASKLVTEYGDIQHHPLGESRTRLRASKCTPPGSPDFKPQHKGYLTRRGFDADYLIRKYDLRVTGSTDYYPYRIIFPITYKKTIVSYQGRSYVDATPKYMTAKPEDEVIFHKDIFFNLDNSTRDTVILVEGVFDAIRLGDGAIAAFGTAVTYNQLNLLVQQYRKVYTLFDSELAAQEKAIKVANYLSTAGLVVRNITLDSGDPGDLDQDDALHLKKELNLI